MKQFVPLPYRKEPVTIRIDIDKLKEIDRTASYYNLNRSEFINRCIDYAMEHMPVTL